MRRQPSVDQRPRRTNTVYFYTLGNQKALELKALVESLRVSAREGTARIRAGLQSLALDRQGSNVLSILDRIDSELPALASIADTSHSPAWAPRSYTTEFLRSSLDRGRKARDTLSIMSLWAVTPQDGGCRLCLQAAGGSFGAFRFGLEYTF